MAANINNGIEISMAKRSEKMAASENNGESASAAYGNNSIAVTWRHQHIVAIASAAK